MASTPDIVGIAGTGTDVGKTWVAAALAAELRRRDHKVAVRKPAQSFAAGDPEDSRDAVILAAATGEDPSDVCLSHRSYPIPMAPPMAAAALGRPGIAVSDLVAELRWPPADIGLVETAGGARSPIADDGDCASLLRALAPKVVVLVSDAGLGTISLVRLCADALAGLPLLVALNRFDPADDLHRRNSQWLSARDGFDVAVTVPEIADRTLQLLC